MVTKKVSLFTNKICTLIELNEAATTVRRKEMLSNHGDDIANVSSDQRMVRVLRHMSYAKVFDL